MNQDERNHFDESVPDDDETTSVNDREADPTGAAQQQAEQEQKEQSGREQGQESTAQQAPENRADEESSSAEARDEGEEVARIKEAMLRLKAEMDNREKRLEREMAKARKFALESLMRDLVQVLDSMDQALASADADNARGAYEGMELTRKQALQVLNSHGLEMLDPVGERFDPSWHEAMATQPSEEHDPDTIVQVLQKGYRLHDRLIRPARVIVAKDS